MKEQPDKKNKMIKVWRLNGVWLAADKPKIKEIRHGLKKINPFQSNKCLDVLESWGR